MIIKARNEMIRFDSAKSCARYFLGRLMTPDAFIIIKNEERIIDINKMFKRINDAEATKVEGYLEFLCDKIDF